VSNNTDKRASRACHNQARKAFKHDRFTNYTRKSDKLQTKQ
jgi:hypothetical protein